MKVLIWNTFELKEVGGPAGYLWNLKAYFDQNNITNIEFADLIEFQNKKKKNYVNKIKQFIKKKINYSKYKIEELFIELNEENNSNIELKINDYDIIHFHTTKDLYKARFLLKNYSGKIVLTSHSPQLASQEDIDKLIEKGIKIEKISKSEIDEYKKFDIEAFERADYIIFPCKEAMEPYLKEEKIRKILENKNIKFLLTGIKDISIEEDTEYFYKKFKIPKNSVVISYVGRHNYIKGYDLAIEFAKKVLEKYNEIYFVIAGIESNKIKKLNHKNWIELGWSKEGKNIMRNSDIYLLPNRETYFDLVFLEALSLDTTILCSYTGGNKFFEKYNSKNILYFKKENINEMFEKFEFYLENIKK